MKDRLPKQDIPPKQYISTNDIAARFGVKGDTVRRNLCTQGHFLGLKPLKLPNGRLLWPAVSPDQIAAEA
ncbi:MAG: monooxygenase [Desulfoprunum sp.]|jgi:hypothetical protein